MNIFLFKYCVSYSIELDIIYIHEHFITYLHTFVIVLLCNRWEVFDAELNHMPGLTFGLWIEIASRWISFVVKHTRSTLYANHYSLFLNYVGLGLIMNA